MREWRSIVFVDALQREERYARVAELVDALASGASVRKNVEVQVLSRAPK
jgi:hypothetical protein